ncbi:transformation/transcription domain-associated protein [Sinocyclocheilus grahami]|uniref:transformation/transcription domain-associated protein n=1 Tax=Sinocyclocheilus grahami TaxID=75366 RepID=UPI0007ACEB35|nr:PREDICTED: transformation/transcription domain-associated protein [Sinocyclocheilus grahami]
MSFVPTPSPTVVDQTTLMKKYLQFVAALTDNNTPDETKLKMMQEVSENFENVTSSPQYSTFLEHIIPRFLTFLQDGEVQFLQEKPTQQLRKLVLEIIHRIPTNEHLRPHAKNILSVMFRFLEIESEENVLICLRIIIELHKQFRPPISQEIHHFLDFVKQIYKELPKVVTRYFENPQVIAENTVPSPEMVGMITSVLVKTTPEREDSETRTHTIIPRGSLSLKVLAELPIIVVLMYQLYKLNIHNAVSEFVPLIMNTIMLQVSPQARQHKLFNKELYADFIAAQIKTLSFLAYIIRIYQDLVGKYSQQMVKGMLQLLSNCPPETAHLRKELLIAAKHILTTDLRSQFIPCMDKLFDESILIGSGYTARETLSFTEKWIPNVIISHRYKAQDTPARRTFEQALTGAFMSAVIKDLRPSALPFVASLIRHYTMVAVAQQCGPFLLPCYQPGSQPSTAMFHSEENGSKGMDPLVLIDAIAICMAYEEKELCKIGEVALAVIFDVASIILGSKERACQLPLFSYIVERLCACCYEQAWYAKLGGVVSIKFLMERLPLIWVLQNQLTFLKALLFVMMDLTGEVSNGAVAMAKTTLEQLLIRCATPLKDEEKTEELLSAQDKSFHLVTHDLVREVTSPNSTVRKQAMHSLQVLAQVTGKSVTIIMEPHKEVLQDMVPPKKHLLRHQPANAQIGLMEGNTFCTTLQPRLFTMDLNVVEHKVFYTELLNLCEAEDAALMKLPCYKSLLSLVPLRIAALNALAACNYLPQSREKIIAALFKALNSTNSELQEAGEACMRKFLEGATIEVDQIHTHMRPLLMMLGDYRSLTLNVVNRLTSVTRLFPNSFNDKFCDQMMQHLRKWMEVVVITHKGGQRSDGSPAMEGVEEMRICSAIINLFHLIPAAPQTLVKPLLEVVMKTERAMLIEAGSPFREPLIKFLTRHPSQTVELFMMEATLNDPQWSRMFMSFLKHKDAKPLRDVLASNPNRFVPLLVPAGPATTARPASPSTSTARLDLQFQAIKIISIIVKNDEGWLAGQHSLVSQLRRVWVSEAFQERHRKDNMAATNWKEPKLLAYCLLCYCNLKLYSFEKGEGEQLLGPPNPEGDNPESITSVFITKVLDPEKQADLADSLRIYLLQFSTLLVEHAPHHIHDNNKSRNSKLRRLMTFAWPCLLPKTCVDPACKYSGHLLLAHIIAKFAIHKKIVLQVFHSLLKAHTMEARAIVRQAMAILTPAVPARMEDGHQMLTHWTRKIIVEEGHTVPQLVHILHLIVQHFRVYYPVRHHLVQHMISAMQRLGFTPSVTIEQRKLAVDLAEVVIKWELQRIKDQQPESEADPGSVGEGTSGASGAMKRGMSVDSAQDVKRFRTAAGAVGTVFGRSQSMPGTEALLTKPVEKQHTDTVVNFLIRIACQVNDSTNVAGSPGELLSRRCVNLMKTALRSDMWPRAELKLQWFDKLLITVALKILPLFTRSKGKIVVLSCNHVLLCLTVVTSELVMLSLDLVKERLSVMNMEMRKNFIQVILTSLIEKSPDPKILRAVVKIVEEWVKNSGNTMATNQVPNPREKSILLVKMMTYIEKRFPDDLELNAQFLDLVNYVYRDENLSGSDITSKLEPAFLLGLRCTQPLIRAKFFEVFDASMKRRVYERLLYICCSQNWEAMGSHFWIKQCIELLLAVCERNTTIGTSCQGSMLPSITNVINLADSHDRAAFAMATHIKQEPRERENSETKEEDVEIDIELAPGDQTSLPKTKEQAERDAGNQLHMLTNRHDKFLDSLREVKTGALLNALVQLCHISTPLAEKTWVQLFPRLWKILSDRQQHALSGEMGPFLCSGSHQAQRDCQPSALNCFVEAMSQCVQPIPIRPCVLKYLGKTHNLWLRSTLMLEQQAFEKGLSLHIKPKQSTEFYEQESITPPQQEILDSLAELYSLLQEEDMWAGLWQKRCKFPETSTAIAYEQHGFFEQAQETYEKAMEKARKEHNVSPAIFPEYQLWEDHWIRCSKELNQWEPLTEYGQSKGHNNPYLVLECAWRVSNWAAMKEALVQVELSCPKEMAWKVNMHRGYLAICHPEEQQLNFIERLVEMASSLAIREWRRLPHIVSHVHTPLLQAAQQIIELQEAAQINAGLQPANLGRNTSLHDMKTVVKTWRNRLPIVSDDLSHWSSIFMWRQHHYQAIVTAYETNTQHDPNTNNAMLGVHASASAIIQYGKIARKQGLVNVALDILSRIHTIPTVPIVDCFQKIRQQVKCYLQLAGVMGKNECMQGLEVIESTNLKYFTKEMTAEFYALKGMFLAQINKSEEANKAFSAAVQMHDVLVKAWAMWGDYLENIFVKDRQPHLGVSAITCYLHACRHQNESKSRKYLAKVLWLLSFDDKNTLADAVDKYCIGVPPIQWLAWIPQLLTCLVGSEGKPLLNLISQVGRVYPQAVYFPIRTLYLTLKIEQRERYKSDSGQQQPSSAAAQTHSASDPGPIRATAPMWRCSRIMHMQRELHPTLLSSLEGIVDQMVWFRENWHEEVLRQLQQGLAKCYSVAFEKSGAVSDAKITPHTLNFVKKLVSTFGVGLENVSNVSTMFSSAASESLARRAQATAQDPVFQKMKGQFTTDFDFSVPGSMKLHNLISKLKKWIKILEAKTKQMPKFFLIEEKCRFLSNFSAQTAEVEIPGEFLMPKPTHYYIKIARFMPRVEIVQKHNTAARRLYIRGHNGKIYPYLVMNDACLTESRREERVLQLLRLLNPCLEKRKETTKRHLFFTVPRVVAVSPQMRLVEDNPSSLSLVEIYKQRCAKKGIEHDNPISRYYDRLATVQARGTQASHQVLRDILKEVQGNMVPRSMLKEWALHTFPNATDYWTFRKMFTIQLALIGLAEFMLHLNRLNPEMLQIAQDTGKLNVSYFRFDINDATGDLDANRPVPFRLTPNISEFLTTIGVSGPLTASMIAVARCFAQPNFKVDGILKAVLRDEIIAWHKKTQEDTSMPLSSAGQPENMDSQQLVSLVQKAVTAIMTRLHNLAQFEGGESKVNTLVAAANSLDNLCRMDPAWHPWL